MPMLFWYAWEVSINYAKHFQNSISQLNTCKTRHLQWNFWESELFRLEQVNWCHCPPHHIGFFAVLQYKKHLINVWDIRQMSETYMIDSDSLSQWVIESMHYCLRPIKGVHFGFANFASHFIRVQIFQIDFPLILYL